MSNLKTRYDGIDILKMICACLVITLHAPFPGKVGAFFTLIGYIAVPSFFLISGFLYTGLIQRNRTVSHLKKIVILILCSNVFYFFLHLAPCIVKGTVPQYIAKCFSLDSLIGFLCFNLSLMNSHLWYLNAILYVLLVVELLRKLFACWDKILFFITPILLIGMDVYLYLSAYQNPVYYHRNFLFFGIPFFSIGLFLFEYQSLLSKLRENRLLNGILIIVFIITTVLERLLWLRLYPDVHCNHYISTTLLTVTLFVFFSHPVWNKDRLNYLKTIGRRYSLMIYIIHSFFRIILHGACAKLNLLGIYPYIAAVLVFFASLIFSIVYYSLKEKLMKRVKTRKQTG